jgi:hypothetical protein
MYNKNWTLDMGDLNAIKSVGHSVYASVFFLGFSIFL